MQERVRAVEFVLERASTLRPQAPAPRSRGEIVGGAVADVFRRPEA